MNIPDGWTTSPASGYGNFTRLTHGRCGWHVDFNIISEEQQARRIIASHECKDLREEREAREAQQAKDAAARQATDRELADLRKQVNDLTARLTPAVPVRLITLDATTRETLAASVDALASTDFVNLATAVDTAQARENERGALNAIRDVLTQQVTDGREAIGVVFSTEDYANGDFLSEDGEVLFSDGTTRRMTFPDAAEAFMELYENVGHDATLAIDLTTNRFDFIGHLTNKGIHQRFNYTPPRDARILAIVRGTLTHHEDDDGDPIGPGTPVGVQFKARSEEDGHYLSSEDGMVVFDDGTINIVRFTSIAAVFAETVGRVGDGYTVSVDLRTGTVTDEPNDTQHIHQRFGITPH